MLNISFSKFKSQHKRKINQVLYYSLKTDGNNEIDNLINNSLLNKEIVSEESYLKSEIEKRQAKLALLPGPQKIVGTL